MCSSLLLLSLFGYHCDYCYCVHVSVYIKRMCICIIYIYMYRHYVYVHTGIHMSRTSQLFSRSRTRHECAKVPTGATLLMPWPQRPSGDWRWMVWTVPTWRGLVILKLVHHFLDILWLTSRDHVCHVSHVGGTSKSIRMNVYDLLVVLISRKNCIILGD